MDKNSAIGLTLIAALLLVYFYWFSPKQGPIVQPIKIEATQTTPSGSDSTALDQRELALILQSL